MALGVDGLFGVGEELIGCEHDHLLVLDTDADPIPAIAEDHRAVHDFEIERLARHPCLLSHAPRGATR